MKKVLTVVKGLGINGISNIIFLYYKNLDKGKIQMDFAITLDIEDKYRKEIENNGSVLYEIPVRDKNPIKYIKDLSRIIKNNKYEIIHVHGNSSMIILEIIAGMLGGAKIRIAHSHNTTCSNDKLSILLRPIFNMLCNVRISCGEAAGKWMFGKRDFITIQNGINMSQYNFLEEERTRVRLDLGIDDELLIGHVGGFNYQKNHEKLIGIFKKLLDRDKNIKLLLVGDGENKKHIEKLVKDLNIENNVIFYGISNNISELMKAIDIFILPSRFEGLPCVLIEAQALGIPCLVSSNVSKEAKIANNVEYIDLNLEDEFWVDKICNIDISNRYRESIIAKKKLEDRGYNIKTIVKRLEQIYTGI